MTNPTVRAAPLEGALEFLRTRTNYEQVDRAGASFGLEPMRALLERLGHPDERLRIVHVAGSKGKGSVTWFVDAFLRRAGVRCGRYLSPHLQHLEERIAIDGRTLSADAFGEVVLAVAAVADSTRATFFDVLTAAALHAFARAGVPFAAVEVGLGGRLDSTNATPKVSAAIASIALEHTDVLGHDLAAIAREKAAIARRGVPLFSVEPDESVVGRAIAARAREAGAILHVAAREFEARNVRPSGGGLLVDVETVRRTYADLRLPTPARYQVQNLALAVAIVDDLEARDLVSGVRRAFESPPDAAASDLAIPGRFEIVAEGGRTVVLDAAHTPESLTAVLESLDAALPARPRVAVLGVSRDKDLDRISRALAGRVDTVLATAAATPRAASPEVVLEAISRAGLRGRAVRDVAGALEEARRETATQGTVLVTGSFYVVGEARSAVLGRER
ncbi:MAG TPA: cyanophycin synthetase [Planctomycetota bacterium]|nr:cyanophycin synthetase [Planctomycetota bacterium]